MQKPGSATQPVIVKTNPSGFQKKPLLLAVGKSASKTAVGRNLVKRRLRAIVRGSGALAARDVTVIAKPGAAAIPYAELSALVLQRLAK